MVSNFFTSRGWSARIKLRELAALTGKLMAANKAFGPIILVMLRSSFSASNSPDQGKYSAVRFAVDHLVITFLSRKKDKLYEGTSSVLKYNPGNSLCPRLIFQTYFDIMKFKSEAELPPSEEWKTSRTKY